MCFKGDFHVIHVNNKNNNNSNNNTTKYLDRDVKC